VGISSVRAGEHRVEDQPDRHREDELAEGEQRDDRDNGEGERQGDAGDRDRAARPRTRGADRRSQLVSLAFLPDVANEEDVVVGAQGEQEDRRRDRDEERLVRRQASRVRRSRPLLAWELRSIRKARPTMNHSKPRTRSCECHIHA
jgi:hypothetical protein